MNTQTNTTAKMPGKIDMVIETVDSFATDKSRSTVVGIDKPLQIDLGLILIDPERPIGDGLQFLNDEIGEGHISQSAFYRFATEFRDRYERIVARYRSQALRIAELAIDEATAGRQDNMATVLKTQLLRLASEKAVTADDLGAFQGKQLSSVISLIDGHTRALMSAKEFELKVEEHERKAEKLEADIERIKADAAAKRTRINEQLKALQKQVDQVESAAQRGHQVDPELIRSIRDQLVSMEGVA